MPRITTADEQIKKILLDQFCRMDLIDLLIYVNSNAMRDKTDWKQFLWRHGYGIKNDERGWILMDAYLEADRVVAIYPYDSLHDAIMYFADLGHIPVDSDPYMYLDTIHAAYQVGNHVAGLLVKAGYIVYQLGEVSLWILEEDKYIEDLDTIVRDLLTQDYYSRSGKINTGEN